MDMTVKQWGFKIRDFLQVDGLTSWDVKFHLLEAFSYEAPVHSSYCETWRRLRDAHRTETFCTIIVGYDNLLNKYFMYDTPKQGKNGSDKMKGSGVRKRLVKIAET